MLPPVVVGVEKVLNLYSCGVELDPLPRCQLKWPSTRSKNFYLFVCGLSKPSNVDTSSYKPVPDHFHAFPRGCEEINDLAGGHMQAIVGRLGVRSVHQQLVPFLDLGLPKSDPHGEEGRLLHFAFFLPSTGPVGHLSFMKDMRTWNFSFGHHPMSIEGTCDDGVNRHGPREGRY